MFASRDEVAGALDALEAAVSTLADLDVGGLSNPDRLDVVRRLEYCARRGEAIGHRVLGAWWEQREVSEFGGQHSFDVLAAALHLSRAEAGKRFRTAIELAPRTSFTGEPLAPELPATAQACASGAIGDAHVQIIRRFMRDLPAGVDPETRERAEAQLAEAAATLGPDALRKVADRLAAYINPDGDCEERERARRRGITLGDQGPDAMSKLSGWVDPELRAYLEAIEAKLARPGMCNPEDECPVVDGDPDEAVAERDTRSLAQRRHDAWKATCRAMLASGELGVHRGLPVTVIATTTVRELSAAAGHVVSAGGSVVPMRDLIRMASQAHHYLAVFDDDGRALHLGRSKRCASADQRIVLYARDRGCTHPGCTAPAYHAEAHHLVEWAEGGETDIENFGLACHGHHPLAGTGPEDWRARRGERGGRIEWVAPAQIDPAQQPRINTYFHPEDHLLDDDDTTQDGDPP
ncbi:MAG TPA: HNH endonuclease signature motif containing protein [Aldersonia sp.]